MKYLIPAALAALISTAAAQNMKYYASDTNLRCERGEFKLELRFDGTGDNVNFVWNGTPGASRVKWDGDQARFDLDGAVNGPFTVVFKNRTFYFLDVACVEF